MDMQTECLLMGNPETTLLIKCRFLHLMGRDAEDVPTQEPQEREVCLEVGLREIVRSERRQLFTFPAVQGPLAGAITVTG
jgi:hypothetical protein